MDNAITLSPAELAKTKADVDAFNAALGKDPATKTSGTLGKDDFLKLLIMQLTHQDPSAPMDDQQFVAQMAQFSSLEQMTNMNQEFSKLQNLLQLSQAINLLGRKVEVSQGDNAVQGVVEAVTGQDYPQLLIDGSYYDYSQVAKVLE